MNASKVAFVLHAHAPALAADDGRRLAVVQAMERAMLGLRMAWTISDKGEFVPVPEKGAERITRASNGGFALYCNGSNEDLATISGTEVPGALCPGGKALLLVHAEWPMNAGSIGAAPDVLEGIAEGARSYWAHVTPTTATRDIWDQTRSPGGPAKSPRGLPMLKEPWEVNSPAIPGHLGWLNYWSAATAQAIGFPDPARDAELLSRSRRTATGGWVVRLTDAPLDLDNPAHLQALLHAYERFPEIGGRATP